LNHFVVIMSHTASFLSPPEYYSDSDGSGSDGSGSSSSDSEESSSDDSKLSALVEESGTFTKLQSFPISITNHSLTPSLSFS
jgi:hypothetical protein